MSTTLKKTRIGVIGCGNISKAYFTACAKFANLQVAACADLDIERARAQAAEFNVPKALTPEELLASPDIDIVVNLTIPAAHAKIDLAALNAGKHVFSEKPFALTRAEGESVVATAKAKGLTVGCAPDTCLGSSIQTCRRLIDGGLIGQPLSGTAMMLCGGHETWHPSPEFYYEVGGGPMFDMGPYYLHALITLLGPVKRVAGLTSKGWNERLITSEPKRGKRVTVEIPTHVTGLLEFHSGANITLLTSFDIKGGHTHSPIEIYGTEGTLKVPDPNGTKGIPQYKSFRNSEWIEMPLTFPYSEGSRGLGVADQAIAIQTGRRHRANEEIAMHALDVMQAIHESSDSGKHVVLTSTCERPAAMDAAEADFYLMR